MENSQLFTRTRLNHVVVLGLLSMLTACGKPGDGKNREAIKVLSASEKVEMVLKDSFGGTYNRQDPENQKLAGRIEGASAFVQAVDTSKGAEEVSYEVRVKVLVTGEEAEISAAGALSPKRAPIDLMNDPGTSARFAIQARCDNSNCSRVIAMLIEKEVQESSKTQALFREAAMIFKRPKADDSDSRDQVEEKSNKSARSARAANEKKKVLDAKRKALEANGDEPLPMVWCAPGVGKAFDAGTRVSVYEAHLKRAEKMRSNPPVTPAIAPPEDLKKDSAASAPATIGESVPVAEQPASGADSNAAQ